MLDPHLWAEILERHSGALVGGGGHESIHDSVEFQVAVGASAVQAVLLEKPNLQLQCVGVQGKSTWKTQAVRWRCILQARVHRHLLRLRVQNRAQHSTETVCLVSATR